MKLPYVRLRKLRAWDWFIPILVFALIAIGLSSIYSASYYSAAHSSLNNNDPAYFLKSQIKIVAFGTIFMFVISLFDYHIYRSYAVTIAFGVLSVALLVWVLKKGIKLNGARRWVKVFGASFQPVDFVKVMVAFILASVLSRLRRANNKLSVLGLCFVIIGIPALLIYKQPNLSSAMMIVIVGIFIMFIAGCNVAGLIGCGVLGAAGLWVYIKHSDSYQLRRITSIFHPFADSLNTTYQLTQSLISVGGGGLFGRGIGASLQNYGFPPYAETDFIFAIIAEETGLFGSLILLTIYIVFMIHGFRVAIKAKDFFGKLLASGITLMICMQAFVHILVCLGLAPTTGVPLPFISYGGTSLLSFMCAAGVLMNISKQSALSDYSAELTN